MIVALDLGGVIVDVDRQAAARRLGVTLPELERVFFEGDAHDTLARGALDGARFLADAAARAGCSPALARQAWDAMVEVWPAGRALVAELLAAGLALHVWSNTDPIHLQKIAAALPPGPVYDTASFHLGAQKPSPAFWSRALALGRPALYLDDRPDFVAAAQHAGVPAATCRGPEQARRLLVDAGLLPSLPLA